MSEKIATREAYGKALVELGVRTVLGVSNISFGLPDRKSTRLNSSHNNQSRMPSSA